jgi:uncharacterized membrane protein
MFQTHCYDAWLGPGARNSKFFMWSQMGGTFPAPLFLFLAGISLALVVDKLLRKGIAVDQIGRITVKRGAEILALGFLFRLQEFVIALGWAPWTDLFRVDILNTIGVSLMLMGGFCWIVLKLEGNTMAGEDANSVPSIASVAQGSARGATSLALPAVLVCALIALSTPLLWTTWRPRFLPWEIESYVDGIHNLGQPQAWLFPVFPWAGFAFAGLALGFFLVSDRAKKAAAGPFLAIGAGGAALFAVAKLLDDSPVQIYPVYDYWHTSPNFFLARVGLLFILVLLAYAWCRWGPGEWGFSPLIQLGQTSLLVYWVHIELVYGRFTILPRHSNSVMHASAGLLTIFVAMLVLSIMRTKLKGMTFYRATVRANS